MFFILVDSYSKWSEVILMSVATSANTIDCLHSIFTTQAYLKFLYQTMSRNSPVTNSAPLWSIKHLSSLFNSILPSNQWAGQESCPVNQEEHEERHSRNYCNPGCSFPLHVSSHSAHNWCDSCRATSKKNSSITLDLLKPAISVRVKNKQQLQKHQHDAHAKQRKFKVSDQNIQSQSSCWK